MYGFLYIYFGMYRQNYTNLPSRFISLEQGSRTVTTCDHQVSVASEETPFLSFQGTWADPEGGDPRSCGFGDKQCYLRFSVTHEHRIYLQLTM